MKIYISGKMSGLPQNNYPKFDEVEIYLTNLGHEVVNPANIARELIKSGATRGLTENEMYDLFMKHDLKALEGCDAILMLNSWHGSRGAKLEYAYAEYFDLKIYSEGEL